MTKRDSETAVLSAAQEARVREIVADTLGKALSRVPLVDAGANLLLKLQIGVQQSQRLYRDAQDRYPGLFGVNP